jgi:hypothetical protein
MSGWSPHGIIQNGLETVGCRRRGRANRHPEPWWSSLQAVPNYSTSLMAFPAPQDKPIRILVVPVKGGVGPGIGCVHRDALVLMGLMMNTQVHNPATDEL